MVCWSFQEAIRIDESTVDITPVELPYPSRIIEVVFTHRPGTNVYNACALVEHTCDLNDLTVPYSNRIYNFWNSNQIYFPDGTRDPRFMGCSSLFMTHILQNRAHESRWYREMRFHEVPYSEFPKGQTVFDLKAIARKYAHVEKLWISELDLQ